MNSTVVSPSIVSPVFAAAYARCYDIVMQSGLIQQGHANKHVRYRVDKTKNEILLCVYTACVLLLIALREGGFSDKTQKTYFLIPNHNLWPTCMNCRVDVVGKQKSVKKNDWKKCRP